MKSIFFIYIFSLYILFIPGTLFKTKSKSSLFNLLYALLFSLICYITFDLVNFSSKKEGNAPFEIYINNHQPANMLRDKYISYYEKLNKSAQQGYLEDLREEQKKYDQALIDYRDKRTELENEALKIQKKLEDTEDAYEKELLQKDLDFIAEQEKCVKEKAEEAKKAKDNLESQLESLTKKKNGEITTLNSEWQAKLTAEEKNGEDLKNRLDTAQSEVTQCNNDLNKSNEDNAKLRGEIENLNSTITTLENSQSTGGSDWEQGWEVQYWNINNWHWSRNDPRRYRLYKYSQKDEEISYWWNYGQVLDSGRWDHIMLVIHTWVWYPQDIRVRFRIGSDDGSRLWLRGSKIIDNWGAHGTVWKESGIFNMQANKRYPIMLEFYEWGGGASLHLQWNISVGSSGFTGYKTIPREYFNRIKRY